MKTLKRLFWNADESRLRSFWRITVFLAIAAIVVNPIILLLDQFYESILNQTLINLIVAIGFFISLVIVAKRIEKSSLQEFGIIFEYSSLFNFLKGTLIGGTLVVIIVFLFWLFGLISLQSTFYTSPKSAPIFLFLFP